MRSAVSLRNSHAIESKPEWARQVVDFSSVFWAGGDVVAGAPGFGEVSRPDIRLRSSAQTLGSPDRFIAR
jgi:hypothetical protein